MLDVDDAEAIRLGQMTAQDTESGGIERIKPKNVAQKLGDDMRQFADMLLRSGDEEASFGQLVDRNGTDVLKWMNQVGAISNTQYQSAFDSKGGITPEAKNDLQKVLYQAVFKGGSQQLEEMFDKLPAKAQRAILGTAFRDMDSPMAGKMLSEIQASIAAYNALMQTKGFADAKNMEQALRGVQEFKAEITLDDRFEPHKPADNFSNFALHLAAMYKASDYSQSRITSLFNEMYDLAQGKVAATLFEEADTTQYPLAEVINKVLNIEYKPAKNGNNNVANGGADVALRNQSSQGGELRGNEPPAGGEHTARRTEPSERGAGTSRDSVGVGSPQSDRADKEEEVRSLTMDEAIECVADMEQEAPVAPQMPLTVENWDGQFPDGKISTPIGEVKMGEHQFLKMMREGRNGKLGMIKPTLEHPHIIIEVKSDAKEGDIAERPTSYVFIKSFKKADGSRYYYFTSISVSKDGMEVIVSNQEKSRNKILRLLTEGSVIWRAPKDATAASVEQQGLDYVQPIETETATKGSGITPQSTSVSSETVAKTEPQQPNNAVSGDSSRSADKQSGISSTEPNGKSAVSDDKVTALSSDKQISPSTSSEATGSMTEEESSSQLTDGKGTSSVQSAVEVASAEVNTEPTPAQAEAGNYKKGHVTIGEFDITIENPVGSTRKGIDADGKEWSTTMANAYGYIKGTEGVDGDHIDVFLHENMDEWNGRKVFVVDQTNPDGSFDEHKVMLGFNDKDEAMSAYLANYDSSWAQTHPGLRISETNIEDFNKWIQSSHRKTKPFADYVNVKKDTKTEENLSQKPAENLPKAEAEKERPLTLGDVRNITETPTTEAPAETTEGSTEATPTEQAPASKTAKESEKPKVNPSGNRLVTDEKYAELKAQLRKKLGGQMNMGVDPEILVIGAQMAIYHIEKGARKFADYAKALVADLEELAGQIPHQYLKGFYKSAHSMLEYDAPEIAAEMDDDAIVNKADVATILSGQVDAMATAEMVNKEQQAERERVEAEKTLIETRNFIADVAEELSDNPIYRKAVQLNDEATQEAVANQMIEERMKGDVPDYLRNNDRVRASIISEAFLSAYEKNKRVNEDGTKTATVVENGTEIEITEGDFIPGVRPNGEQKPSKKPVKKPTSTPSLFDDEMDEYGMTKTDAPSINLPEEKPAEELAGDSAQHQEHEKQTAALVKEIGGAIADRALEMGMNPSVKGLTMSDIKKMAAKHEALKGIRDTDLQELVELAMTNLTRQVAQRCVNGSSMAQEKGYNLIVSYYLAQPSLNARDSERLMKQQYSTPTPFGYVMGQFVQSHGKQIESMLEPSAGNGALTITINPEAVHVNDIDDARLANLRKLGFGSVTAQDALLPFSGEKVDAVMTNPPFGTVTEKVYDGIFKITSLEGQMAINALDSMKADGRAAIVIGGKVDSRTKCKIFVLDSPNIF